MGGPGEEPAATEQSVAVDHRLWIDFPPGWVNLTLGPDSVGSLAAIVEEAVNGFSPLELTVSKADLTREMTSLAAEAEESHSVLTGAYYTDAGGNLANLEVMVFGEDGVHVTPAEIEPMLLEKKNAKVVGEPQVRHLDLPIGRAVRVQATYKARKVFGFGGWLVETVTYGICPSELDDVLVATMRWEALKRTEELTEMADTLIPTLRLIPVDANGVDIDPGIPR